MLKTVLSTIASHRIQEQIDRLHGFVLRMRMRAIVAGMSCVFCLHGLALAGPAATEVESDPVVEKLPTAKMLAAYYHEMSVPKPMLVRNGDEWKAHQKELRKKVLRSAGLWPLPERISLDVHESAPLDHPWCTVRRIYYQLWPGVYANGLLYLSKNPASQPAPAMLCPHGHWPGGNTHEVVQKRCLNFARLGYVTFSSPQDHYEDLLLGISHQTLMLWSNLRAMDYLESLEQVDKSRIGAAGASGGGLQTQMLVAVDARVRAATIVGLTCDFREIMSPDGQHCDCNHFPGVMQFTDHPEISTLGLPAALQFLTMNDWTKNFQRDNLPTIRRLYESYGLGDRVDCMYYDTPHSYDKAKRERTYAWMERWVRGNESAATVAEPDDVNVFSAQTLQGLSVEVPKNQGFKQISHFFVEQKGYQVPTLGTIAQWRQYRRRMRVSLRKLLGMDAALRRIDNGPRVLGSRSEGELLVEHVGYSSEGGILVPTTVIRCKQTKGTLPVVLAFSDAGREALLAETGEDSPRRLALDGALVVLPDVRCYGQMLSTGTKDKNQQWQAWQRNGIVWGRPVPGMACTDIAAVLDGLSTRSDADMARVTLRSRQSGGLAIAALFAAALDSRIDSVDVDFDSACFQKRNLPLVSGVLQYGDVLQWAALLADRQLTLHDIPSEAGDPAWLQRVLAAVGNGEGLQVVP